MAQAKKGTGKRETRNTKQKRLIIECLNKYGSNHMTAEELLNLIHRQDDKISIATVYRNLRLLEKQGLVHKVFVSDDATAYYEAADSTRSHSHHHLVCRQCGAIIDFEDDLLEPLETFIEQTKGFTIEDHRVTFFGICAACKEKNRRFALAEKAAKEKAETAARAKREDEAAQPGQKGKARRGGRPKPSGKPGAE